MSHRRILAFLSGCLVICCGSWTLALLDYLADTGDDA